MNLGVTIVNSPVIYCRGGRSQLEALDPLRSIHPPDSIGAYTDDFLQLGGLITWQFDVA